MSVSRTLSSPATSGLDLRIDYGQVRVVVGTVPTIEVTLSTPDDDDSPAAKAIRGATIENPSMHAGRGKPGDLVIRRDTYARVHVPDTSPSGGGVIFHRDGGISVHSVSGSMSIVGSRVFVNGQEVHPSGKTYHGIEVEVRLPSQAALCIDSDGADVTHVGDPLAFVKASSTSGGLTLRHVARLEAETVSGRVVAEAVQMATARTTSGKIRLGLAGDVDLHSVSGSVSVDELAGDAQMRSTSGSVFVVVKDSGEEDQRRRVSARSVSGSVTVRDPDRLHERGVLSVTTKSVSGSVSAPGASSGRRHNW